MCLEAKRGCSGVTGDGFTGRRNCRLELIDIKRYIDGFNVYIVLFFLGQGSRSDFSRAYIIIIIVTCFFSLKILFPDKNPPWEPEC